MASKSTDSDPNLAERVAGWFAAAGVGALMLAIVVVMADILMRKSLGFSIRGTIDLTQLAQMTCAFLALPYVFLRESNISVEAFTNRLPRGVQRLMRLIAALITLALMLAITWYSFSQAGIQIGQGDKSVTLGIPILAYWLPTLTGMALSCAAVAVVLKRMGSE